MGPAAQVDAERPWQVVCSQTSTRPPRSTLKVHAVLHTVGLTMESRRSRHILPRPLHRSFHVFMFPCFHVFMFRLFICLCYAVDKIKQHPSCHVHSMAIAKISRVVSSRLPRFHCICADNTPLRCSYGVMGLSQTATAAAAKYQGPP